MKRKFITTIAALLFITTSVFALDFVGKFKIDNGGAAKIVNNFRDAYFEQLKDLKIKACIEVTRNIYDESKPATYIKVYRHTFENYQHCFEGETLVFLAIDYFSDDNTFLRGVKWTNNVGDIFEGCYVDCSYKVYTLKDGIWYTQ